MEPPTDYIEPFWSSKPLYQYTFEVMKEGAIVDEIELTKKQYYVVGRQQDAVDIWQENPTISRRHAVIQHKDTGDLFIYDLGSTHGTFLNKKLLPKNQYIKLTSGDMLRFGQSTRWFILSGGPETTDEVEEAPHKRIQIVSKKQNEAFIFKNRVEQIRKLDAVLKSQQQKNQEKLHGGEDQGVSWGMDDDEEEISKFQKGLEQEGSDDESREGASDDDDPYGEEDDGQLIDLEKLKQRDDLTEKQNQMINQIEGIRRHLKKIIDKKFKMKNQEELEFDDTKIKGSLKGIDKRAQELKDQMEKVEAKLKTSLRSKRAQPAAKENEDDIVIVRRKNSDDEEDEFFDRTKHHKFNEAGPTVKEQAEAATETYESIKSKLESLIRERQKLTNDMQSDKDTSAGQDGEEEEDELEMYMKQTNIQLKLERQKKIGSQIAQLNSDIERYTRLIALVAPSSFSHKAHQLQPVEVLIASEEPLELAEHSAHKEKQSIQSTIVRLKEMSQLREQEMEEKKRKEDEMFRKHQEAQLKRQIQAFEQQRAQQPADEDVDDSTAVALDEDSGLKNYFKEIVKNAGRFGDKLDMTQYQNFVGHYNRKREEPVSNVEDLEEEVRGPVTKTSRHEHNKDEDERRDGEIDDWVPPIDQQGDGKTQLNAKFGY